MIKKIKNKIFTTAILSTLFFSGIFGSSVLAANIVNTQNESVGSVTEIKGKSIPNGNSKITLSFRDTNVQQILRMFADKAGLNIVFHESAQGAVTLDLVDVSLEDAFKMVMKMTNLTYAIKDNTMLVVSANNAEELNLTKDSFTILPVKYADAAY